MSVGVETKMTGGEVMMEVEEKELTSETSLTYQPQVELEPAETLTELKPVKQSVTYDSQTGKMYAELGTTSGERGVSLGPEYSFQYSSAQYQTYSLPGVTPQYSGPPYTTTYTSPPTYDRLNTTTSTYHFNTQAAPTAFLPHSAINLSVKTEESGGPGQGDPSPQILDLTRPLSGPSPSITFSANTTHSHSQPADTSLAPAKVQTEPVDFSSSQTAPFTTGRPFEPPGREGCPLLPPSLTEPGLVLGAGMAPGGQDSSLSRYRGGSGGGYTTSLPLPSPYDTICSSYPTTPYPPYQQSTYSCLTAYPPTSFPTVPYQDPLSLAYTTASLSSTIPSPDSCIKPDLG